MGNVRRAIVCGGRDTLDTDKLRTTLRATLELYDVGEVIHGGAPGADTIAGDVARDMGLFVREVQADWHLHGKAAGPIRNRKMLNMDPDIVSSLPGGRGTMNMRRQAGLSGVAVVVIGD